VLNCEANDKMLERLSPRLKIKIDYSQGRSEGIKLPNEIKIPPHIDLLSK